MMHGNKWCLLLNNYWWNIDRFAINLKVIGVSSFSLSIPDSTSWTQQVFFWVSLFINKDEDVNIPCKKPSHNFHIHIRWEIHCTDTEDPINHLTPKFPDSKKTKIAFLIDQITSLFLLLIRIHSVHILSNHLLVLFYLKE